MVIVPTLQFPSWLFRPWAVGLTLALGAGILFRLIWGLDIEYKGDEAWMFQKTQTVGKIEPWPWLGMPTCSIFLNPGMNVWIFVVLGNIFQVKEPPDLARAIQILNILAILGLVYFTFRLVPIEQREAWLWAIALLCVNPLAVLFHRKIWQPCLFPFFTLFFLVGWWRRNRWWGAFLWGLIGACLGQIQMAGFFFAAGFVLWAFLYDRKNVRWSGWFAGSFLGTLPLIPWIYYILHRPEGPEFKDGGVHHYLEFKFWTRWITDPLGISVHYSLENDFWDYLRYPLIQGQPTYFMLILHGVLAVLSILVIGRAAFYFWNSKEKWMQWWSGAGNETVFTQNAGLWGFGLLMTLSAMPINRHYLLVATPLMFVWLARQVLQPNRDEKTIRFGRWILVSLCLTLGLISAGFLGYIHVNQRKINGDFGTPYGAQVRPHLQTAGGSEPNEMEGN